MIANCASHVSAAGAILSPLGSESDAGTDGNRNASVDDSINNSAANSSESLLAFDDQEPNGPSSEDQDQQNSELSSGSNESKSTLGSPTPAWSSQKKRVLCSERK